MNLKYITLVNSYEREYSLRYLNYNQDGDKQLAYTKPDFKYFITHE